MLGLGEAKDRVVRATIYTATLGLMVGVLGPAARADYGPGAYSSSGTTAGQGDVVGVGSDTVQNIGNFLADGDTSADPGFNGNGFKWISFDATPDENDRAGYLNGSTNASLKPLTPTIIFRGGTNPVRRPNGNFTGIQALLNDNHYPTSSVISFVRASQLPKCTDNTTAVFEGFGGLHVVKVATDPLQIAVANTTNAPSGLSITETVKIYDATTTVTWAGLGLGTSTDAIIPEIPPGVSDTRSAFINDLQGANGGVPPTLANPNIITTEENDPFAILNAGGSSPSTQSADVISPFSGGRLNLYNSGYFHDPTAVFPGGAALNPAIKVLTTTAPDGFASYDDIRALYYVFRDRDKNAPAWQPGGTQNWVHALFVGSSSYVAFLGQPNIAAAGVTPVYSDLGFGVSGVSCT